MVLTQTAVLARRNLLHVWTDPQQLVGMTVQPLMFLLLFVYVFGGAIAGSPRAYLQFVLPGLLVQGVAFGTSQTAVGLNADFSRGLIDRFRALPIARSAVVAGRVTADLVRTGWAVVINIGAATVLGFRFHGGPLGAVAAVAVVLAFGFALSWLMACVGIWLRSPEAVQTAAFLIVLPLTFASSVLVPASSMPGWLQAFVTVNPITVVADTVRGLMLGGAVGTPAVRAAAWLLTITVVTGTLTVRGYRSRA
jgi:ABC transporter DrrB family efflux protein